MRYDAVDRTFYDAIKHPENILPLNLDRWKRDWTLMSVFFSGDEIASITEKLKNLEIKRVAFCSFENRFARSGGLAAVTTNILPFLKEVNHIPSVLLITPFYSRIMGSAGLTTTPCSFTVPYQNKKVKVQILEHTLHYKHPCKGELKEYYLKADGFFEARNKLNDPYRYDDLDPDQNAVIQSHNALFFCKAVPLALKSLGIREDIVFHLHEWQTSLISFTAKEAMLNGTLKSCGTVQTMHNSYDATVPWDMLTGLVDRSRRHKIPGPRSVAMTAYQIGLQLVDAPITTVSEHFADELTSDIMQVEHYAPHLQNIMKASGVYGVNNGMFDKIASEFPKGEKHTRDEVRKIKLRSRRKLLKILGTYRPPERFGDLTFKGKTISGLPENIPIILMSGRLDPTQKGYYVLLRALENFGEDEIKAVLTPMPVNPSDLDYFYEIACKCRGNVLIFPLRMEQGYHELQTGATFGVMPSIYEPFGAAVEYMACGTVNIARATGGLVDQVDSKCGFLFKEDAVFCTSENMRNFVDTKHIIQMRKTNPWAQSMADNLYEVIKKATHVYQNRSDSYYQMILNGFKKTRQFNWEQNADRYYQIYEMIQKA